MSDQQAIWTNGAAPAARSPQPPVSTPFAAAAPPVTGHRSRHVASAAVLVAILAVVPYLNSLQNGFTFDDPVVVRDNPRVTRHSPVGLLTAVYPVGVLYRPLTMLTYAANYRLSPAAWGFHFVNLALHLAVSLGVLALALVLLDSLPAAVVAAALFAVHPIHTEAVNNIVGRAELLAAALVIASLLAQARAVRRHSPIWSALALVSFALALLAKESAFTAIALIAVLVWWLDPARSWRRAAAAGVPFLLVGIAYLFLRHAMIGSLSLPSPPPVVDNPLAHVALAPRLATALVVLLEYCSQLFLPLHLAADYSYNEIPVVTSVLDARFLLALGVLLALTAGTIAVARRAPALALAAMFTVVPLALTANVLFPIGTIKAERLLYLPSVGWCLAAGWLVAFAVRRRRVVALVAVAAVTVAFAGRTWLRNRDWRDDLTLFTTAVQAAPDSAKAHYNLAVAYDNQRRFDEALLHLHQSLRIFPDSPEAAFVIGTIYEKRGLDAGAVHWYARACALRWEFAKPHLNIGSIRFQHGEYTAAEAAFRTGLAFDPTNPRLLLGLSLALRAQGQGDEARLILAGIDAADVDDPSVQDQLVAARLLDEGQSARAPTATALPLLSAGGAASSPRDRG